ncbi:MAG: DUF2157 domain-containing protein [Thermoguttaceae bacterium]|nr:DUF2157 domain-containing protein [Thermoguttaceae bacterium]
MQNADEKRSLPQHALRWLQTEIDYWLDGGLVDSATAARLRALYVEAPETPPTSVRPDRRDSFGRFLVFATATLGALALGIALYFILSQTWAHLGKSFKIAVLVGSLALANLGGFAARRGKRPNFSAALFFLGAFVFGLSVWQFAEIFRFEIEFPTAYWLWGALAFGVAFFGDRAATHYLAVPLLVVWTIAAVSLDRPTGFSPAQLFPALPNAALSLPIFAALGYRWGVRRDASGVQLLYALLGVFWAALQYLAWTKANDYSGEGIFASFYLFFLASFVYFAGSTLVADRFVASKLRLLSAAPFFVFLLVYSRYEFYEDRADLSAFDGLIHLVFFAGAGAVALATFFVARRKRPELFAKGPARRALLVSPVGVATLMLLPFLLALFGPLDPNYPDYCDPSASLREAIAILSAAWTNLLVLAVAGVAFLVGAFRSAGLYWFGVVYFLIWLTLRYFAFDLDDATLAACFFGAISVALFSAAFFLARLRARLDADPENARREPAFVAFLADALDAPTAAETSAVSQSDDATPRRFKTCALAAVVAAQFAILGFIAFEASRPFIPVESFVVEASVERVYDYGDFQTFGRGRERGDAYLSLDYPFADQVRPEQRNINDVLLGDGDATPVVDEMRGLGPVYVVLRRDPETGLAWATRRTSKRPASLASDEVLLVGRRMSRRTRIALKFPGVDELPTVPKEFEEELKEAQALDRSARAVRARVTIETAADGSARIAALEFLPSSQEPSTRPQPQDDATPKTAPQSRRVFQF